MNTQNAVRQIFSKALLSVDPFEIVRKQIKELRSYFTKREFNRLFVIGFGKASYDMARAVEAELADLITEGIIVTKYGHALKTGIGDKDYGLKKIKVYEAGHPVPDVNGAVATGEIIKLLKSADEKTLVLCLVSGGGSALLVFPCEGISLTEKQAITDLLLKSGADITELNTVRKHLSKVKGGRLAEIAHPAEVVSLIISDVIGDNLDVIASGPTVPDTSTFAAALDVVVKRKLENRAPEKVTEILRKGNDGLIPDTPKQESPVFEKVKNTVIGSNRIAIDAAKVEAESLGFDTEVLSYGLTGEARETAKWLADKAKECRNKLLAERDKKKICLISGGETTVTVKGNGKGGRNTELALSFAIETEGTDGIALLSAGTDGTDGPTDAAGAVVDGNTVVTAKGLGLNPLEYLLNNDSYSFFKKTGSLLITGPTGTNVMDIQITVIE